MPFLEFMCLEMISRKKEKGKTKMKIQTDVTKNTNKEHTNHHQQ